MMFDLQPDLENDRVRLGPMQDEDFEPLFLVASDPLIWEQHPANDRYKRDVFRAFFDAGMESGGAFIIIDKATEKMIGSSRYYEYDKVRSEIVVGFTFFARSHWGGPYNRATKHLMLDHAFRFVDNIVLYAGPNNHRSCRAIEKIGGVQDAILTKPDGDVSVRYVIRKPSFNPTK
jgi:RimJ/RimL family protein N-acetyltransferase